MNLFYTNREVLLIIFITISKELFFNCFFIQDHNIEEKKIKRTIVRRFQSLFLMLFFLLFLVSNSNANIQFNGICGSYSYKLDIPTNKYFGGQCVNDRVIVYNDKGTDEIQAIYADPLTSEYFDIYDPQNFKVLKSFDSTLNDSSISYVGENGGLTYVLAGSFIGFTILFFSSFIFIEVAKK